MVYFPSSSISTPIVLDKCTVIPLLHPLPFMVSVMNLLIFTYMNTSWVPHLEMSPKCFTMTTTALFPASKQTHCALAVCDSEWVTSCTQRIFNIHLSGHNECWCHVKLLPSQCKFCGHHRTMHQFTASFYSKPHRVHVCLAVTSWQNDWDLCSATAVTQGWNGYRNKLAQKAYPGEENFPATPAGSQNQDLSITSLLLLPLSYPCSPEW